MAGKRTSVYLTEELAAAVDASGVPLAELVRRGLGADERTMKPGPIAEMLLERGTRPGPIAAMFLAKPHLSPADCPHRGLRPGAWCKTCQSAVPERKAR